MVENNRKKIAADMLHCILNIWHPPPLTAMNPVSIALFYKTDWDIKKALTILAAPAFTSPPHSSS